jgi:hypothetical protein
MRQKKGDEPSNVPHGQNDTAVARRSDQILWLGGPLLGANFKIVAKGGSADWATPATSDEFLKLGFDRCHVSVYLTQLSHEGANRSHPN